jgi:hypothetical protein
LRTYEDVKEVLGVWVDFRGLCNCGQDVCSEVEYSERPASISKFCVEISDDQRLAIVARVKDDDQVTVEVLVVERRASLCSAVDNDNG